jgi:LDH2 family malate/lactate/ureidoglycolate dehydrogenase
MQRRKGESITEGWAQDPQGLSTTDADLAFKTGCLMPLGGPEITSGYKGYGLGLLVETFCGILAGTVGLCKNHANLHENLRPMNDDSQKKHVSQ